MTYSTNISEPVAPRPIGVFDSGYGGLTVLRSFHKAMPQYDFLYLGDNARAPYGSRSFDVVYRFTLEAVQKLFEWGCPLVVLACNTASAKALRSIQQNDLPQSGDPSRRVLGVIRPTVERLSEITKTGHIGVFGTPGTIASESYDIEIGKINNAFKTTGHSCPMWVPLVENNEYDSEGADYFVRQECERLMEKDPDIDTVILACTHYPLLIDKIKLYLPEHVKIIRQGDIVAESLVDYLARHPEMEKRITRGGRCSYLTTESPAKFSESASIFMGKKILALQTKLGSL